MFQRNDFLFSASFNLMRRASLILTCSFVGKRWRRSKTLLGLRCVGLTTPAHRSTWTPSRTWNFSFSSVLLRNTSESSLNYRAGLLVSHAVSNRYVCDAVTATSILLCRLSFRRRWYDVEGRYAWTLQKWMMFSGRSSSRWLIGKVGLSVHVQSYCSDVPQCTHKAIRECSSPLDHCMRFLDCTEIRINRPVDKATINAFATRVTNACTVLFSKWWPHRMCSSLHW